jgi:hypothetical protein
MQKASDVELDEKMMMNVRRLTVWKETVVGKDFEILTAVSMKMAVSWSVTPCKLV